MRFRSDHVEACWLHWLLAMTAAEKLEYQNERTIRFTNRERDFVFAVAMKMMKDEDKAHDVTQDALLLAYRHRESFKGESRFTTWLYRIATTTALMHLRKERGQPRLASLEAEAATQSFIEPASLTATPEESVASAQAVRLATQHLDEMGDKYGTIFAKRFFDGYTETEIASDLDLNVATVKTRAFRARSHVRGKLAVALSIAA